MSSRTEPAFLLSMEERAHGFVETRLGLFEPAPPVDDARGEALARFLQRRKLSPDRFRCRAAAVTGGLDAGERVERAGDFAFVEEHVAPGDLPEGLLQT